MTLAVAAAKRGGRGIDWRVVGGDAAAGHRHAIQSVTSQGAVATYTAIPMPSAMAGATFISAVLLRDGRVYFVPAGATSARIYDPSSNSVTTASGTFSGSGIKCAGGVLLHDGRVFIAPRAITTAYLYDPVADTLVAAGGVYPGNDGHAGCVLMPNGKVFVPPFQNNAYARIYDPVSDTTTTAASNYNFGANFSYWGAVLLLDGRVFVCPLSATSARIYDPATDTVSVPGGAYPGNFAVLGGVLLADGRVYCVPYQSTTARIYNPTTNSVSTPGGTFPGLSRTGLGQLLPDGRVLVSPQVEASVGPAYIHDVDAGTVVSAPHCGGVFSPQCADGSYIGIQTAAGASLVRLMFNRSLHSHTRLSPHYNKI